ncbi:oligopeptide/dipeptide ABC transporter, ATP-binding protein, C-terminal domain-containing protein [Monaibacterium marinum]|uniref:Oligopeptide/dipeptide ABC transporter, ATP-binding protein, C-terminal domain-containing protein n=1 Tax=Pontivivens marinum TaxID=1690039 RepID=A0A2C9CVU2_9RHOB|nr:ABC transporter ATP-binding protein [Monaibacterium marinum]SOH95611.1 oligopeptide/dipeptide ABC transporter, ATP-binding protein, C-terminal domain-containing protein [Monaibacterium marinum]
MTSDAILSVRNVTKRFGGRGDFIARGLSRIGLAEPNAVVHAVEDVSFDLRKGEVLGVVGESGCGKSTLGRMVAGLLDPSEGEIVAQASGATTGALPMQMIFQDPFSSLNPRKRVSELIGEAPRVHGIVPPDALDAYVADMMDRCGVDGNYRDRFAHQFSGGQRQRIGIARALAVRPEILVCDEAVSALDVSIQAQIVNLFMDLRDELGLTYIFISHDLGVVEHISDRILVMYLGRIVESGPAEQIFADPQHPYTRALIEGVPRLERRRTVYAPIKGDIPSPIDPPKGCHFHPRCPLAQPQCKVERPALRDIAGGRQAACHLIERPAKKEISIG